MPLVASSSSFSVVLRRLARLWPWALAVLPAFLLLMMMTPLRVAVPYLDSWAFVKQYQDWIQGQYGWQEFLAPHYNHPSVPGKAIYFAVLHWLHGDVGLLPWLSWAFSAVISGCVLLLSRPLWKGRPVLGAGLFFCANLTIFSAAQGGVWIWDFVFQNYLPGLCLVSGLVLLSAPSLRVWRILVAGFLGVIATFSFGSGFLVALLFSMLIWHGLRESSLSKRCLVVTLWLAFHGVMAWVALKGFETKARESGSLLLLLDRPLLRLQFVLILLGRMLGEGTVFQPQVPCLVMGSGLVAVFVACGVFVVRRRHDPQMISVALPWIACCLFGVGNAVLICIGRMDNTFSNVLAERFITFTLFFVLGTLFLVVLVMQRGNASRFILRRTRGAAGAMVAVFVALHVVNWEWGWQAMKVEHMIMEQERSLLSFAKVLPLDPDRLWNHYTQESTASLAIFLADHDQLREVEFVTDKRLSSLKCSKALSSKWARFDRLIQLHDGTWQASGVCGFDDFLPDLVILTAQAEGSEESIIALAPPLLPDTFFEGPEQRRRYADHFYEWSQVLDVSLLPKGPATFRAYLYEQDYQRVRPLEGMHVLNRDPEGDRRHQESLTPAVAGNGAN